jgi:hypothetical protein
MNAARELLDDLAVIGATVEPAGDRLILRAGPTAIPAKLVNRVREAKADLIATLARHEACEQDPASDSEPQFKCRTLDACVVEWLNRNPSFSLAGRCVWCGKPQTPSAMVLPFGASEHHAWLHAECWSAWYQRRREEAVLALRGMGITGLPSDEPPAKPVEPPAQAPQTRPSASNGIPEDRRGFVGYVDGRFVHYCPGAHTESESFCAAASSEFGTARSTSRRRKGTQ